jgi:uncharacterized protein (DUF1684 family)
MSTGLAMTAHPAILLVLPLAASLAAQPGPTRESQVMAERADKDATFATSPTSPLAGVDRRTFPAGTQVWLGAFGTGYATGQPPLEGGRFRLTAEDHRWAWASLDGAERGWVTPGKEFRMGTRTVVAYPQPETLTVLCFDTARPERQAFAGLRYFKYDPGYAAQATLRPVTSPVKVVMGTSRNQEKTFYRYAEILFTLGGKPRRLAAYKYELAGPDSEILFIPFTDLTTGKETYAAGRFLEIPDPHATSFTLDFNQAFNPLCNYSDSYNCPRPPSENALAVAIRAGELTYGQGRH